MGETLTGTVEHSRFVRPCIGEPTSGDGAFSRQVSPGIYWPALARTEVSSWSVWSPPAASWPKETTLCNTFAPPIRSWWGWLTP